MDRSKYFLGANMMSIVHWWWSARVLPLVPKLGLSISAAWSGPDTSTRMKKIMLVANLFTSPPSPTGLGWTPINQFFWWVAIYLLQSWSWLWSLYPHTGARLWPVTSFSWVGSWAWAGLRRQSMGCPGPEPEDCPNETTKPLSYERYMHHTHIFWQFEF